MYEGHNTEVVTRCPCNNKNPSSGYPSEKHVFMFFVFFVEIVLEWNINLTCFVGNLYHTWIEMILTGQKLTNWAAYPGFAWRDNKCQFLFSANYSSLQTPVPFYHFASACTFFLLHPVSSHLVFGIGVNLQSVARKALSGGYLPFDEPFFGISVVQWWVALKFSPSMFFVKA